MKSSEIPMRRFECGSHDPEMICAILDAIHVVHVGCYDEEYPYVVPMNFAYELKENQLIVYLHTAREGHKIDLWKKNPHVCLTFSMFYNHPDKKYRHQIHDFRSVIALGTVSIVQPKTKDVGKVAQMLLKQNDRKPGQCNVQHMLWMGGAIVTCDLKDVSAKFENPIEDPKDVPFVDVYHVPEDGTPYDWSYFYHKKPYEASKASTWIETKTCNQKLALPILLKPKHYTMEWTWYANEDIDLDISAFVLNKEGIVKRRYDMAFYNQKQDFYKIVTLRSDDILSQKGLEILDIDLEHENDAVQSILLNVSIFQADQKKQTLNRIHSLQMTLYEDEQCLGCFPISLSNVDACAATLFQWAKQETGWMLSQETISYDSWKILDIAAVYGLSKWKE